MPSTTKTASTASSKKATKAKVVQPKKVVAAKPVQSKETTHASHATPHVVNDTPAKETAAPPSTVLTKLIETRAKVFELHNALKTVTKDLAIIEKEYNKEVAAWNRRAAKKKGKGSTSLSGFAKPGYISKELCNFLNVTPGTEMAHTDVTKQVIKYIKEKDLQDSNNKRVIIPDDKLSNLLQPDPSDTITFFNLQTYMKHHYLNPAKQKQQQSVSASA